MQTKCHCLTPVHERRSVIGTPYSSSSKTLRVRIQWLPGLLRSALFWIRAVRYFDTVGKELRSLLDKPLKLSPMATTEFVIARDERAHRSGTSFLVEWKAGTNVTSPLVETLSFETSCKQGLSFVAPAMVLDETELIEQVPQAGT